MPNINLIESWWRHNGLHDRHSASGIPYNGQPDYLKITDDWWDSLTDQQKEDVYIEFFSEY